MSSAAKALKAKLLPVGVVQWCNNIIVRCESLLTAVFHVLQRAYWSCSRYGTCCILYYINFVAWKKGWPVHQQYHCLSLNKVILSQKWSTAWLTLHMKTHKYIHSTNAMVKCIGVAWIDLVLCQDTKTQNGISTLVLYESFEQESLIWSKITKQKKMSWPHSSVYTDRLKRPFLVEWTTHS